MNLGRARHNDTRMLCECHELVDRRGRDVVVAIAKMTWAVSALGKVTLPAHPTLIRETDELVGAGRFASVLAPSDVCDERPGTDVLLVGFAHPPRGAPVAASEVSVRVETGTRTLFKRVIVYGPRVWQAGLTGVVPGPAARLDKTPLVYEHAWGGADESDPERPLVDWRNPAGSGVARDRSRLVGRRAPSLEDPQAPIGSDRPAPACFAPIPAAWQPRLSLAGTHDDAWHRERAPLRPRDFDPRHHCQAPSELWSEPPLVGDEPIEVLGATPEGAWRFRLPRYRPIFRVIGPAESRIVTTHLDTLLLRPEERRVELTWRAAVPAPRKLEAAPEIVLSSNDALPDAVHAG